MVWGPKDAFIASCGIDGGIYEWSTLDWTRKDFALNNTKCYSMIYDEPIFMLLSAGTESLNKDNKTRKRKLSISDKKHQ